MKSIFSDSFPESDFDFSGGYYENVHDILDTSKLAVFRFKDATDTPVYQDLIVTGITEGFSEGNHLLDVFGDSFVSFSTGANPIGINIQGYLVKLKEYDNRIDFLEIYENQIRGTAVQSENRELQFLFNQTTKFTFYVQSIQVLESAPLPELTGVSMQGVAFEYGVVALTIPGNR